MPLQPPEALLELYNGDSVPFSQTFLQNIRTYNSSLAFASMNCTITQNLLQQVPYCFRIHGQVYYRVASLHPPPERNPRFCQIYIFDTERASLEREEQARHYNLNPHLLMLLHNVLREHHPLASMFYTMGQVEELENQRAANANIIPRQVFMHIRTDRADDQRRYNAAAANEIAAVFTSEDGTPPSCLKYEIVIHPRPTTDSRGNLRHNELQCIQRMNPNCDPMIYPLLFPYGEQGWRNDIRYVGHGNNRPYVSPMRFYSYKLQVRNNVFSTLHHGRKLFHQYIVDAYTKIEGYRLDWIRNQQAALRVDRYQGLMDYVERSDQEIDRTGRRFILPSTFIGSPRAMQQNFQDAIAIVRELGKPDLFITITCNPKWPEITSSLLPGQTPGDRPDIICRVFSLKLKQIMDDITKGKIFGDVSGFVYTIEFQKRGLPHAHLLLILHQSCKIREPEDVDRIVCAEIPSPLTHPNLYEAVASHMMHGPCGGDFPN